MKISWFTTAPSPSSPKTGFDAGQRGWKLHAVLMPNDGKFKMASRRVRLGSKSLCGLRPAHGWGFDLFIDEPCQRCLSAIKKRKLDVLHIDET